MNAKISSCFGYFIVNDIRQGGEVQYEIRVKNGPSGTYHQIMYDSNTDCGGFKVKTITGVISGKITHAGMSFVFNASNNQQIKLVKPIPKSKRYTLK